MRSIVSALAFDEGQRRGCWSMTINKVVHSYVRS